MAWIELELFTCRDRAPLIEAALETLGDTARTNSDSASPGSLSSRARQSAAAFSGCPSRIRSIWRWPRRLYCRSAVRSENKRRLAELKRLAREAHAEAEEAKGKRNSYRDRTAAATFGPTTSASFSSLALRTRATEPNALSSAWRRLGPNWGCCCCWSSRC